MNEGIHLDLETWISIASVITHKPGQPITWCFAILARLTEPKEMHEARGS